MTRGDWIFWAVMAWIGFNLIWLGLLDGIAPLWVGWIIGLAIAFVIFRYGPRAGEEEEE
jgi:predicted small integral membrane protein